MKCTFVTISCSALLFLTSQIHSTIAAQDPNAGKMFIDHSIIFDLIRWSYEWLSVTVHECKSEYNICNDLNSFSQVELLP